MSVFNVQKLTYVGCTDDNKLSAISGLQREDSRYELGARRGECNRYWNECNR